MSNILLLLRCQWHSYWRRLQRAGGVGAANQGIVLLILVLVVIKYFQLLHAATVGLSRGNTTLLRSLLTGIFIAWLFPLTGGARAGEASRRLLHLPVSHLELFSIRLLSLFIPPTSWLILVASLGISYPLLHAPSPVAGIVSALLLVVSAWQTGIAVAHLLSVPRWRKVFVVVGFVGLLAAAVSFRNGFGAGDLNAVMSFSPVALVLKASFGKGAGIAIGALTLWAIGGSYVAFWSFRMGLEIKTTRSRRRIVFGSFHVGGRLGGLITKDFRYFRRLLDPYVGLLVSVMCCIHLVAAEAPSADVVRIFILVIFLFNSSVAFNLFGLDDRNGLNRYTLLPLAGSATLLSKNLAFLVLVGAQLSPIFLFTTWRLGFAETGGGMIQAISLAAAYLAWGNWMSVSQPTKLQFFRFSSSGFALADVVGGLIFGSLPGVLMIYGMRSTSRLLWVVPVTLIFLVTYFLSVVQFGKRFEVRHEAIANMLS